jgi:hypothetical protein
MPCRVRDTETSGSKNATAGRGRAATRQQPGISVPLNVNWSVHVTGRSTLLTPHLPFAQGNLRAMYHGNGIMWAVTKTVMHLRFP